MANGRGNKGSSLLHQLNWMAHDDLEINFITLKLPNTWNSDMHMSDICKPKHHKK